MSRRFEAFKQKSVEFHAVWCQEKQASIFCKIIQIYLIFFLKTILLNIIREQLQGKNSTTVVTITDSELLNHNSKLIPLMWVLLKHCRV